MMVSTHLKLITVSSYKTRNLPQISVKVILDILFPIPRRVGMFSTTRAVWQISSNISAIFVKPIE